MPPKFGNGKICYIEIPATDTARSAEFYRRSFGWNIRSVMIYIFDIDGTIAHSLHFITQKSKDWASFFAACGEDKPIEDVLQLMHMISEAGNTIILVTGRSTECEQATLKWLHNYDVPFATIYMRKEGDYREDSVVKGELLDEILDDWREDKIAGVFEDRQQVVDMYRSRGLRVYQVAKGDF